MNQPANVIEIAKKDFAVIEFNLTPESVTDMIKKYDGLELIPGDKDSYKEIHTVYMKFKKARTKTDKRRRELGTEARNFVSTVNSKAKDLIEPLAPYEQKFKEMLDEEDQREANIEIERQAQLDYLMTDLQSKCELGLNYNRSAKDIQVDLDKLQNIKITDEFQEREPDALDMLTDGIVKTGEALAARILFENEQARQEQIRKENEAAAKKLADEKAEFAKKQAEAEKVRKKEKAAEDKKAAEKAQKLRFKEDKIKKDAAALRKKEKEIEAQEQAQKLMEYRQSLIPEALIMDESFEKAKEADLKAAEKLRKAKLAKDKKRAKLIVADQKIIETVSNDFLTFVSEIHTPYLQTPEAIELHAKFKEGLKDVVAVFKVGGIEL